MLIVLRQLILKRTRPKNDLSFANKNKLIIDNLIVDKGLSTPLRLLAILIFLMNFSL